MRRPERVTHLVLLGSVAQGRRKRARTSDELEFAEARIEIVCLGWGHPDPNAVSQKSPQLVGRLT